MVPLQPLSALNVISSNYDGTNSDTAGVKNFGATINGSLNSIESATAANSYSGIGNAVVGTANRTYNSNGSLIFGAVMKLLTLLLI